MKHKYFGIIGILFFTISLFAQSSYWPKEIRLKTGGKILFYQPQPDELNGNILQGRSAVGVKEKANDPMMFGAIFFNSQISTDKDTRMATLESIQITNAKLEGLEDQAKLQKMIKYIESEVPKWNYDFSIDQLVATIKRKEGDGKMYNNTPPKIFYATKPTALVIINGEPIVKMDKDLDAERVLNSPNLIFKEGNQWNMYNGGTWYKSSQVTSGWTAEKSMSAKVKSINEQIKKQEKEANDGKAPTEKPIVTDIIVTTEAAELIQTEGAPVYKAIDSTTLQYITNTDNDIIKAADGTIFILLAGRWYKSSSLNGPWTFNGSDKMPVEFAKIPEGSEKGNVLVSISGTPAAEEAIIDAEIPQTAKVDRKAAKVEVEYDGNPQFETISGTTLQLAENSNLSVFKEASGKYFVLDNGVWFEGSTANGPWSVAITRPEGIESIPASSSAYNTKYVFIYEVTADYVVTGYTAGYLGCYVQGDPVIIFGTGFFYRPWYGSIFFPRPITWGLGFSYNPWFGWTMGFGFNVGFMHIGFRMGPSFGGGWFGPPFFRPPFRPPMHGRPGGGNNININTGGGNINVGGNQNNNNIYNRPGNGNNGGGNRPGISSGVNNNNRPGSNYRPGNNTNVSGNRPGNNTNVSGNRPGNNTDGSGNRPGNNTNNSGNRPGNNTNGSGSRPANNTNNSGSRPGGGNNNNTNWNNKASARPSTNNPNNVFSDKSGNVFRQDNRGNINQRDNNSNTWRPANNAAPSRDINREAQSRDRGNQRTNNFNNSRQPQARPAGGPSNSRPAARPATRR